MLRTVLERFVNMLLKKMGMLRRRMEKKQREKELSKFLVVNYCKYNIVLFPVSLNGGF